MLGAAAAGWRLAFICGPDPAAVRQVRLDQDLAWRLFTKGASPGFARSQIRIGGDRALGETILHMVSIMA